MVELFGRNELLTYCDRLEFTIFVIALVVGLKKRVEVGNSDDFRPEMLLQMGLPENVVVIPWGLSLERPTKYEDCQDRTLNFAKLEKRAFIGLFCRAIKAASNL